MCFQLVLSEASASAESAKLRMLIDDLSKEVSAVKVKEEENRKSHEMEVPIIIY